MNYRFSLAVVGFNALSAVFLTPASAYSGQALERNAKIKMTEAMQIALKSRPGKITDRELEHEGGGSGLRYSFDVVQSGKAYEVGIDAMTGRVLENGKEGAHPD